MEINLQRDGLTLRGDISKPENIAKCPIVIIFHGLMSDRGSSRRNMFTMLSEEAVKRGIAAVKFDFDGHGSSDGKFEDMTVYGEILDAVKIIEYVRCLDWVTDIYIAGHSQGALVGGMIAGYYSELVSKLVLLSPAATIKDDALSGNCFGKKYDIKNPPKNIKMFNINRDEFLLGNAYMRTARTLPIYDTTSRFEGKTLIIHGTADQAVGVIGSKRYAECMDNVKLYLIENETHGLDTVSLENVITEVVDFLAE